MHCQWQHAADKRLQLYEYACVCMRMCMLEVERRHYSMLVAIYYTLIVVETFVWARTCKILRIRHGVQSGVGKSENKRKRNEPTKLTKSRQCERYRRSNCYFYYKSVSANLRLYVHIYVCMCVGKMWLPCVLLAVCTMVSSSSEHYNERAKNC